MPHEDKLLEKMRRSKSGWTFIDLEKLYLGFGFEKHEKSKHTFYMHPIFKHLTASVTRHRSLPIGYIQHALKLIAQLKELSERGEK